MYFKAEEIIKDDNPMIRQKSQSVPLPISDEDKKLALKLLSHVKCSQDEELSEKYNIRPAVGIAAVQVGILKQLLGIYINFGEDAEPIELALANPKIISSSIQQTYLKDGEGCLSVEQEHQGFVPRSARIKVRAYDCLHDQEVIFRLEGYPAIVLQHEIDHFSGTLFYDHINQINPWQPIEDAIVIE
ncbi:MAG: peptide deformylase [Traorella sp.]